jgi:MFS family permease
MESLQAAGGLGVLAVPDFRRLWLVGLAVSVARWLEMLVIGIVVFQVTGSALVVAGMTLLRVAPMGLFGALIGVLADRAPRRWSLLGILVVQGSATASMALLAAAGRLEVWHLAIACFAGGLGWATDNPVRRMLMGEAIGASRMGAAMSLDVVANNASRVAGPAFGGTLLAAYGAAHAFGLAAVLYLVAILLAVGLRGGRIAAPRRATPVLRELRETFAVALRRRDLRAVLLLTVIFNLFAWPCTSMIPVIGKASLGLGPEGIGLLASMDGIGALLGAGLVALLGRPDRYALLYAGGTGLYLLMMVAFALAPYPVLAGGALLVVGIGGACFATTQATLIYLVAPPELRGRLLGVLSTAIGTGLLGYLQIGLLAEWLGAPATLALTGTMGLLALGLSYPAWRILLRQA